MLRVSVLNDLLGNLLNEVPELLAVLVVDLDGLVIAQRSVQGFDEEIIGAIMSIVQTTIEKIKKFAETTYGSGSFDTNDFRLFYVELGGANPALFVLVADPYSDIEKFIPYSYIVAEKVSLLLSDKEISAKLPKLSAVANYKHDLEDDTKSKIFISKIVLIGPQKVGKSTLLDMYINGNFDENYKPTMGFIH